MLGKAPQDLWRLCCGFSRGAWRVAGLWLAGAGAVMAQDCALQDAALVSAGYEAPTERYPHAVLGDSVEYGALRLTYSGGQEAVVRLPQERVFEDLAPRVIDLDNDGRAFEVMVVESHQDRGARLAIYTGCGLLAATPFIGQRFRWLAPVGAADLDGDGNVELAYVDRPHLAKTLRVWRFERGALREIAALPEVSNHRIGWDYIIGGLRRCGPTPEMIVASGDWTRLRSVVLDGELRMRDLGPYSTQALERVMGCK